MKAGGGCRDAEMSHVKREKFSDDMRGADLPNEARAPLQNSKARSIGTAVHTTEDNSDCEENDVPSLDLSSCARLSDATDYEVREILLTGHRQGSLRWWW